MNEKPNSPSDRSGQEPPNRPRNLDPRVSASNNNQMDLPPSYCEVCGKAISPTEIRCANHEINSSAEVDQDIFTYRISHIAFAIIPGTTSYHALAKGTAALKLNSAIQSGDHKFQLIDDINGSVSKTLTRKWESKIPKKTTLASEAGREIFREMKRKGANNATNHLYTEYGEATNDINSNSRIQSLLENNDKENIWLVPVVINKKRVDTTDRKVRYKNCNNCGKERHVLIKENDHLNGDQGQTWICTGCHKKTETRQEQEDIHKQVITTEDGHHIEDLEFKKAMGNLRDRNK